MELIHFDELKRLVLGISSTVLAGRHQSLNVKDLLIKSKGA